MGSCNSQSVRKIIMFTVTILCVFEHTLSVSLSVKSVIHSFRQLHALQSHCKANWCINCVLMRVMERRESDNS